MGISALHQILKTLCLNTDWNYAVFWKLDPRTRMMLTCEDAYYEKNDLLALAIAKMSYQQYSLGEGIVGQLAVMDKHLWISGDQLVDDPHFSIKDDDGWKTQFAAGIRTIAVVSVVPHGVLQLGSLINIPEDLKTVNQIREIFLDLQASFIACTPSNTTSYNDTITSINYGIKNSHTTSNLDPNYAQITPTEKTEQQTDTMNPSFKFPAGFELYEALGPAFYTQNNTYNYEKINEIPETSSSNLVTPNSGLGPEHLLEAVVGNVTQSDGEFSNSVKWVEARFNDMQTSGSGCYSFESSLGFSSASQSRCSDPLERSQERANVPKKRAKPGESSRPRPRDRQLIQDRIKELRELVPNGSKCSIDSLLERTIKHMLFMQCVTKHADKIDKYAESKLLGKETGIRGTSNHEQGSSWAMEVGNQMKVCPVTVENIGTNGQMLVEMMCEEGVHFLEIADAIRSLGLTIIKGVMEPDGDKSWMCFVVEGENNRNVHRMDILWLLVQILQSKAKELMVK